MSRLFSSERLLRYGPQVIAAIAAGLAFGWTLNQARAETVESLLADPKRLALVQAGCKTNQPWATEALCREAAEATRRRFRGGGARYTPQKVEPFPSRSVMRTGPAAKSDHQQARKRSTAPGPKKAEP